MSELLNLAARVEAASGPDRALDALIRITLLGMPDGLVVEALGYTSNFADALSLVPDEHSWAAGDCNEDDQPWACVTEWADTARDFTASAHRPALALTAAALRARAALAPQSDTIGAGEGA